MKKIALALLLGASPFPAIASDEAVLFRVSVKDGERVVASPSFLANVGEPASIRLADGLSIEALPKAAQADGRSWTRIRITYFETEDAKFVQEMQMRHAAGERTGSFEYTDPAKRRYVVTVGR